MKHLLSMKDVSLTEIKELLSKAQAYLDHPSQVEPTLAGCFVANMFFESSTRTRFSFEVSEKRLGLDVLNFQTSTSSIQKGESLYDSLKTMQSMGVHAAVIRHSQNGILPKLANQLEMGIINAGTGHEEHPTQALLDVLTIQQEFQHLQGLKVAIIGDIQHSRVARSTSIALEKLGATIIFSGPEIFKPKEVDWLKNSQWLSVDDAVAQADVVMMLRIQFERHEQQANVDAASYHSLYGLTGARAEHMLAHAIIMHPAPVNRDVEIATELVESKRSRIFKQIQNGVGVRMAVLESVLRNQRQSSTVLHNVLC